MLLNNPWHIMWQQMTVCYAFKPLLCPWLTLEGVCPAHWGRSAHRTQTPSGAVVSSWRPPAGWPDSHVSAAAGPMENMDSVSALNSPKCWTKCLIKSADDLVWSESSLKADLNLCYFLQPANAMFMALSLIVGLYWNVRIIFLQICPHFL